MSEDPSVFVAGTMNLYSYVRNDPNTKGHHKKALKRLGLAIHVLQDATSPAHADFRPYYGGAVELALHAEEENFDPGPGSKLDQATYITYAYFTGALPLPNDFFKAIR